MATCRRRPQLKKSDETGLNWTYQDTDPLE